MKPNDMRDCGKILLGLFRDRQFIQHGNHGCRCSSCETDMIAAIEELLKAGDFLITRNFPTPAPVRHQLAADIAESQPEVAFDAKGPGVHPVY